MDRLLTAVERSGWKVTLREPVGASGGPNPTRVDLSHRQQRRQLLLYAWQVHHEGKGRNKDDFRVQVTRTHTGDAFVFEPGRTTVGAGWEPKRDVFAGFDGWTKRLLSGRSPSVHITETVLGQAAADGWAKAGTRWDERVAFTAENAGLFVGWMGEMNGVREAPLNPIQVTPLGADEAEIVGGFTKGQPTGWIRVGDRIVLVDGRRRLFNNTLWRVTRLDARTAIPPGRRNNRTQVHFFCERTGTIDDPAAVAALW